MNGCGQRSAAAPVLALLVLYSFVTVGNVVGDVGLFTEPVLLVLLRGHRRAVGLPAAEAPYTGMAVDRTGCGRGCAGDDHADAGE